MSLLVAFALALAGLWSVEIVALVAASVHRRRMPGQTGAKANRVTANA